MKNFKEYLFETKKLYNFKIKIAGPIPENFETDIKKKLERCKVCSFEKMTSTPIQKIPVDFPNLENQEITVYEVVLEYPITAPEIAQELKQIGMLEEYFRIRGSQEPSEIDQTMVSDEGKNALLLDPNYTETTKIKHKDYFGDEFNKSFLKDLDKAAKEHRKESGHDKAKPDVLGSAPKIKTDKLGNKSAIGS